MRTLATVLGTVGRAATTQVQEAALVLPVLSATACALVRRRTHSPSTILCGSATRSSDLVVLVHGFGATPKSWSAVVEALGEHDLLVATFGYATSETSVERLGSELAAVVTALAEDRRPRTVHLVGHSLGGLVIGEALADAAFARRVESVVTLGSPLRGS